VGKCPLKRHRVTVFDRGKLIVKSSLLATKLWKERRKFEELVEKFKDQRSDIYATSQKSVLELLRAAEKKAKKRLCVPQGRE
jgi:hypothetical protein